MRREFRVRVEPEDEPTFDATVNQSFNDLHGYSVPDVGWSITVIYDPDDHSKIVMDVDAMPVRPGVDLDEAVARHERALARHRQYEQDPGANRRRAEEIRAVALDSALSPEEKRAKMMELSASLGGTSVAFSGGHVVASADGTPADGVIDALTKLADLRDRGVLTDAEFEAPKAKILGAS